MSNRILRDTILTERNFNALTFMEESLYSRLVVSADDYGVYYADPVLLPGILFPRKPEVTAEAVRDALEHMEVLGLISRYTVNGEEYLQLRSWEKDQRIRNSRHKFPPPGEAGEGETAGPESERPADRTVPEGRGEDDRREGTAAGQAPEPEVRELPVVELPLNDNTAYGVTQAEIDGYAALYPAVDVAQELRNMRGWCMCNPQRRKTRSGVKKFINSWLARAQNQGGSCTRPPAPGAAPVNPFLERLKADAARVRGGGETVQ